MIAVDDRIVTELRNHNRRLEDDLTLAKGEAHFLRIKLNSIGACVGDCDECLECSQGVRNGQ